MKHLFLSLLGLLNIEGDITDAVMYGNTGFSRIVIETESGKYAISISKEEKTDGNNGN